MIDVLKYIEKLNNKISFDRHKVPGSTLGNMAGKAKGFVFRRIKWIAQRTADRLFGTYMLKTRLLEFEIKSYYSSLPVDLGNPDIELLLHVTDFYLEHRFDILGSGRVQVKHGMKCNGLEGYRYDRSKTITLDSEGKWLQGRINQSNLTYARHCWKQIEQDYIPIDWHLDFKSGYRWRESTWYKDISFGHKPGVDIKIPWELARMQHLPQLAYAYSFAVKGRPGFRKKEIYLREFRNQVLDFIATNSPRYGVNWMCSMEAAIRVSNWLLAYDMFLSFGGGFDEEFEGIFVRSVYEHGLHIVKNLEWTSEIRGNHYLSDIVGLLFVASYLPKTPQTDTWLAFAVQEIVNEVEYQFFPDGTNFEASTPYHRFAAELIIYATGLVLGLPPEKQAALKNYDNRLHNVKPKLNPSPIKHYPFNGGKREVPFSGSYIERIEKMVEFIVNTMDMNGYMPQIGDNDSGRFFELCPSYFEMTLAEAKNKCCKLKDNREIKEQTPFLVEDHLDCRDLIAAFNGLIKRDKDGIFSKKESSVDSNTCQHDITLYQYPHFGLYIYRSKRISLSVRCGLFGPRCNGGHAHNDQLSFTLAVDGTTLIIDPGTYLYTPLPEMRNLFRSTGMHNTLTVIGREQNTWFEGKRGLFELTDQTKSKVVYSSKNEFIGEHSGFGSIHRRILSVQEGGIKGLDECYAKGEKSISFHFAPEVKIEHTNDNGKLICYSNDARICLQNFGQGKWNIKEGYYSPRYGVIQKNKVVNLCGFAESSCWSIEVF